MNPGNQTRSIDASGSEGLLDLSNDARALEQDGDLAGALGHYQGIIRANPGIAQAYFQAGRLAFRMQKFSDAARHLVGAARLLPAEQSVWELLCKSAARAGDNAQKQRIRQQLSQAPLSPRFKTACERDLEGSRAVPGVGGADASQVSAAMSALRDGHFEQAATLAEVLHRDHPEAAPVALILGNALMRLGRIEASETAFRAALEAAPDYAEAHHGLGLLLIAHRSMSEGLAALEKAAKLAPDLRAAQVALARALIQIDRDIPRATTILQQLRRKYPTASDVLVELGRAYVAERRMQRAVDILTEALELMQPALGIDATLLLVHAMGELEQFDAGHEHLDALLAQKPTCGSAYIARAALLRSEGKAAEAQEALALGVRMAPRHTELRRIHALGHAFQAADPELDALTSLCEDERLSAVDRANVGFALAKASEESGDYHRVMPYLHRSNRIEAKRHSVDASKTTRQVEELLAAYQDADFTGDPEVSERGPIFVTGLPQSGMSVVNAILGRHRQVTPGGDIGFARKEIGRLARGPDGRIRDWAKLKPIALTSARDAVYARQKSMFSGADIVTDLSTDAYLLIGPILAALPNAKVVVVQRDLRDTAFSIYRHKFAEGRQPFSYDLDAIGRHCRAFEAVIDFWRKSVPGRFYEVHYDGLLADPDHGTRSLLKACDLEFEASAVPRELSGPIGDPSRSWRRYINELGPLFEALGEGYGPYED